jgi:predicted tellurium resistance membrane protein TerC
MLMPGLLFNFNVPRNCFGIDNIIFISIAMKTTWRKPQKKATKIGMFLYAMFMRIILY